MIVPIIMLAIVVAMVITVVTRNHLTDIRGLEEKVLGRTNASTFKENFGEMIRKHEEVWGEEDKKREKKREYQRKYRARKKLEKKVHELMMQVQGQNKEHTDKFERYDILDFD